MKITAPGQPLMSALHPQGSLILVHGICGTQRTSEDCKWFLPLAGAGFRI